MGTCCRAVSSAGRLVTLERRWAGQGLSGAGGLPQLCGVQLLWWGLGLDPGIAAMGAATAPVCFCSWASLRLVSLCQMSPRQLVLGASIWPHGHPS